MKKTKQKVIVEQGRVMSNPKVPYEIIDVMIVDSEDEAKDKVKELRDIYGSWDAISISYFSL